MWLRKYKITGQFKILHNDDIRNFYKSPNRLMIMIVKSGMLLFIMNVNMTEEQINVYRILVKNFLMKHT
jgi:hypothetical protein